MPHPPAFPLYFRAGPGVYAISENWYNNVKMPLNELTDSVLDGNLVQTNEIKDLREMISGPVPVVQKFYSAENYLLQKFRHKQTIPLVLF